MENDNPVVLSFFQEPSLKNIFLSNIPSHLQIGHYSSQYLPLLHQRSYPKPLHTMK